MHTRSQARESRALPPGAPDFAGCRGYRLCPGPAPRKLGAPLRSPPGRGFRGSTSPADVTLHRAAGEQSWERAAPSLQRHLPDVSGRPVATCFPDGAVRTLGRSWSSTSYTHDFLCQNCPEIEPEPPPPRPPPPPHSPPARAALMRARPCPRASAGPQTPSCLDWLRGGFQLPRYRHQSAGW